MEATLHIFKRVFLFWEYVGAPEKLTDLFLLNIFVNGAAAAHRVTLIRFKFRMLLRDTV